MRGEQIEAIGELAGEALAAGRGFVEQMDDGIAGRPFRGAQSTGWMCAARVIAHNQDDRRRSDALGHVFGLGSAHQGAGLEVQFLLRRMTTSSRQD